jgi:hypothetical protein
VIDPPRRSYRVVLKPASPATAAGAAAEKLAQEISGSELANVRKAADNWRTGLIAMLGLVTTVLVVKGRESFADLSLPGQLIIGTSLIIAIVLAAVGSWQAMRAAYGDPKPRQTADNILTWDRQDALATVESLKLARRLFFGALAAILVAVIATWFWPTEEAAKVRADFGSVKVCGKLVGVSGDGLQLIIKEDGTDKSNPIAAMKSLAIVKACP